MFRDCYLYEIVGSDSLSTNFNVAANLQLIPLFNEEDVDTFLCCLNGLLINKNGLKLNAP